MSDTTADPAAPERHRKWTFPSTYTILAGVTVLVWSAAFVIPPGTYDHDDNGRPVAGTYHRLDESQSFGDRLRDLFLAPINGLYCVQDDTTGQVGPDMSGALYGAAAVFLFVLAVGAFITVAFGTGALDAGIGRLAYALRRRSFLLIVGIMVVFAHLVTPTTAVVTGGIALAKVRYDRYVRFVAPLMGILLVLICAFLAVGAWIG
ncbi:hypothetical protein [Nocardia sp. CC227C]|uniref:hypothetical protein n=1 Tax=Nocardia sp. CC227C TaxID=3044562 RepID=UPI00278C8A08|nr:hypothetical protein [Nocardia sp. CC227C]